MWEQETTLWHRPLQWVAWHLYSFIIVRNTNHCSNHEWATYCREHATSTQSSLLSSEVNQTRPVKPPWERKTRSSVPPLVGVVYHSDANNRTDQRTQMWTLEDPIPTLQISLDQKQTDANKDNRETLRRNPLSMKPPWDVVTDTSRPTTTFSRLASPASPGLDWWVCPKLMKEFVWFYSQSWKGKGLNSYLRNKRERDEDQIWGLSKLGIQITHNWNFTHSCN